MRNRQDAPCRTSIYVFKITADAKQLTSVQLTCVLSLFADMLLI